MEEAGCATAEVQAADPFKALSEMFDITSAAVEKMCLEDQANPSESEGSVAPEHAHRPVPAAGGATARMGREGAGVIPAEKRVPMKKALPKKASPARALTRHTAVVSRVVKAGSGRAARPTGVVIAGPPGTPPF